jgi:hypothetical protein
VVSSSTILKYNILQAGVIGATSGAGTVDQTATIQSFVNRVVAEAQAVDEFTVAVIDFQALFYRVQNLTLPGNVHLRLNGAVLKYTSAAANPPTGPGNYVVCMYGNYNKITGGVVSAGGAAQTGVGGAWLMPSGAAYPGSPRSYQCRVDATFAFLAGRAIYDQGVANHIDRNIAMNCLLGASPSTLNHFMGVVETAGSDGYVNDGEYDASVVETAPNGVLLFRCPNTYDNPTIATTNGGITLPLVNGSIVLVSAGELSTTGGGVLSIGGHIVSYGKVSGSELKECYCADTGTIATATKCFRVLGFVCGFLKAGSTNWSQKNVAEFSDSGIYLGPTVYAHTAGSEVTLETSAKKKALVVDNACHLPAGETTVAIWSVSGETITFNQFTYTSISQTALTAPVTVNTVASTLAVESTAGWPSTGTFNYLGYKVTYTSIVDGTHIGGCTISEGSIEIPSGGYIRSNTLNECYVAASTLVVAVGRAVLSVSAGSPGNKSVADRADHNGGHGWLIGSGTGTITSPESLRNGLTADNAYDGYHNFSGSGAAYDVLVPHADSSAETNRMRYAIIDLDSSASATMHWIHPRWVLTHKYLFSSATAGGGFTLAETPTVENTTATPEVQGITAITCTKSEAITVTNFLNGIQGQRLTVMQNSHTTIENNANIVTKTKENIPPPASGFAALEFQRRGNGATPAPAWYQV